MSAWLENARSAPIIGAAQRLGLVIGRDGKSFGPCPQCNRERRSSPEREKHRQVDKRPPCIIWRDPTGRDRWRCVTNGGDGCGARGDVIDLVAIVKCDRRLQRGDEEAAKTVRDFFGGGAALRTPSQYHPQSASCAPQADRPRLVPEEVAAFLYGTCVAVVAVPEVAEYLVSRRLDPATVAERQLAFALPRGVEVPAWARCGGMAWWQTGYQLIVPMFAAGPDGKLMLAGVRARAVRACGDRPKSLAPLDKSSRGLVFAAGPNWLMDSGTRRLVTIAEGEIDTLTLQLAPPANRGAVLGCISGSACLEFGALMPPSSTVVLAMHADPGGHGIARAWLRALAPYDLKLRRCAFERIERTKTHLDPAADRVEDLRP